MRLASMLAALFALACAHGGDSRRPATPDTRSFSPEMIDAAARYLVEVQDESGRFTYRINLDGRDVKPKYNVLRHAGTIYALAAAHSRSPSPDLERAIRLGARHLVDRYIDDVRGHDGLAAVFSRPDEESLGRDTRAAKLGGTGLGLVALLAARSIDPGVIGLDRLRELGRFVLFMQDSSGRFQSKFYEDSGFDPNFVSLYYPGEAVLGLVMLYEASGDSEYLQAAARGIAYLVRSRADASSLPADHWLMIASAALLPHYAALQDPPISEEDIVAHATALGEHMMREQAAADLSGGFAADGRCTPTATRLEGLIALHGIAGGSPHLLKKLEGSIGAGISFLTACQVPAGPHRGAVLRAVGEIPNDRKFNRRQREVRIDYVQHTLSAFIGWESRAMR